MPESIDSSNWQGEVTAENIEQVREALGKRLPTQHIAISKHELFSKDNVTEGDYILFTPGNVTIRLVYGSKEKEYRIIIFNENGIISQEDGKRKKKNPPSSK